MSEQVQVPDNYLYMKPKQIDAMEAEIASLKKQIEDPRPGGADKGEMLKRVQRMQHTVASQQAPDLSAAERDAWAHEEKRLRDKFVPHMLSGEEMRKAPAGSVDAEIAFNRRFGRIIARWKNVVRALHRGDDRPDISNIERLRPHRRLGQGSMHDVQIEGKSYFGTHPTEEYKRGWDRTFGDGDPEEVSELAENLRDELGRTIALREELQALAEKLGASSEPGQPEAVQSGGQQVTQEIMPCGAQKAKRGRAMHIKHCEACRSVLEKESATA